MQDLSFLTRDETHAPCSGSCLNHWTAGEIPSYPLIPSLVTKGIWGTPPGQKQISGATYSGILGILLVNWPTFTLQFKTI